MIYDDDTSKKRRKRAIWDWNRIECDVMDLCIYYIAYERVNPLNFGYNVSHKGYELFDNCFEIIQTQVIPMTVIVTAIFLILNFFQGS